VCLLTDSHDAPTEGNYHGEHGNAIKPAIEADYNCNMGHLDKADRVANSYTARCLTWKWTKQIFSHLLDLAIVNSYILSSCGGNKISRTDFRLTPIREMLAGLGMSHNHPCLYADQLQLPLTSEDWTHVTISTDLAATPSSSVVTCSARGVTRTVILKCAKCDVALRVDRSCSKDYNTKHNL
jgi:hypothetical protein